MTATLRDVCVVLRLNEMNILSVEWRDRPRQYGDDACMQELTHPSPEDAKVAEQQVVMRFGKTVFTKETKA